MFGPERFSSIESPNVIDPGDAPPMQPKRNQPPPPPPPSSSPAKTKQTAGESSTPPSYRAMGLGRTEKIALGSGYDDQVLAHDLEQARRSYKDDDNDGNNYEEGNDDDDDVHHSLPSIDEARNYAATLLVNADKRTSKYDIWATEEPSNLPSSSNMPLDDYRSSSSLSKHLVRNQVISWLVKGLGLVLVITLVVLVLVRLFS